MVAGERNSNTASIRYRAGTALVWLGVLTWLPFIILRVSGEKPPLLWYLPIHLLGVIGGSRLRSSAKREMDVQPLKKSLLFNLGHGLILCGVLVWVPYFYLKLSARTSVEMMNFLPYHLAGVLGGITVLVIDRVISQRGNSEI